MKPSLGLVPIMVWDDFRRLHRPKAREGRLLVDGMARLPRNIAIVRTYWKQGGLPFADPQELLSNSVTDLGSLSGHRLLVSNWEGSVFLYPEVILLPQHSRTTESAPTWAGVLQPAVMSAIGT